MNKIEKSVIVEGKEDKVDIYVIKPLHETLKQSDRIKAKSWNQCLQDEILIKKELESIMSKRGIWDQSKSEREQEITKEIVALEKKLYKGDGKKRPKVSEGQQIAIQMRRLRIELRDLIAEKIALEENTAEALAENAKFDYLVSECTFYKESRERVYKDLEDYSSRSSDEIAFAAASALGEILFNLDSSFEKNLPENKWLKKFDLVDDDLSLIDTKGDLVDTDGKKINEKGFFLNEEGKRIDRDGELLDEDGNYIMADYENDLVPNTTKKKAAKPTTTTKKEEVTETTDS